MLCPSCQEVELRPVEMRPALTRQGVQVDYCDCCHGIWLDRGELFHFAKDPKPIARKLAEALNNPRPIGKISPVTSEPMVQITYPGGPRLDFCPRSKGIWLDANELQNLLAAEPGLKISLDQSTLSPPPPPGAMAGLAMLRLPNRFLSSIALLFGLYGFLTLCLIVLVEFAGLPVTTVLITGGIAALLDFLIGPYLLDLTLRWFFRFQWLTPDDLPAHLRQFAAEFCRKQGMKFPSFGLIEDGAPQAFTYGHRPNNARIVLSRGILNLLSPQEVEAVLAHELGHAVHWDMLLVTAAQFVPLVLYYIYRWLVDTATSAKSDQKAKTRAVVLLVALGAFVLYALSEYLVLWFSRQREYYADRFAGEVTKDPGQLASALVKVAYGLAGLKEKTADKDYSGRSYTMESVKALGIFDNRMARALAVSGYSPANEAAGHVDRDSLKGAMRWDLWNPWARWYELNSTHPLVAKRLRYLSDQARFYQKEPYIVFDEVQPESYWDEFLLDLMIYLIPVVAGLITVPLLLIWFAELAPVPEAIFPGILVLLGATILLRYYFSYRGKYFPGMSVAALLKRVKVSDIRPVPCTLQGTVIGRGIPGFIFSEDFVMQDETGIIFLDYRQPLALWELIFGLLQAGSYTGKQVTVQGWYRRSPIPYVQIHTIECDGQVSKSYVPIFRRLTALIPIIAGLFWGFFLLLLK
jgi:Zn-dependent protease with chaperone function/Zn-finger nucleic acid-binding protein